MADELLGTVTDEPTLTRADFDRLMTVHQAAFGLIVKDEKVAVMYAKNEGHHELPGGGAENDETPI